MFGIGYKHNTDPRSMDHLDEPLSLGALATGNMPFAMAIKINMIDSQLYEGPWSSNLGVFLGVSAINPHTLLSQNLNS